MRKTLFLYILFFSFQAYSQVGIHLLGEKRVYKEETKYITIDTCKVRLQYYMSYAKDTNNPKKKHEEYMLLQCGKHISKFSNYFLLKADSLSSVYAIQKMNEEEALNKLTPIIMGCDQLNIFKDYPNAKITVTDMVPGRGFFRYVEEKSKQNWKLGQGSMIICGYECRKATTTFRGRRYVAWYAPKIAIGDGPWKFWGLPGLILQVTDEKNEYSFICSAIERPKKIEKIYMKEYKYINTTKKKFVDIEKGFYTNPGAILELKGLKTDEPSRNMKSLPYNPIELSE